MIRSSASPDVRRVKTRSSAARAAAAESIQPPTPEGGVPAPAEKTEAKKKRGILPILLLVLIVFALLLPIGIALTKDGPIDWLFKADTQAPVGEIADILAPLLAVALAIERLMETVWDWQEKVQKNVIKYLDETKQAANWVQQEYLNAYDAAEKAFRGAGQKADAPTLVLLNQAEERLAQAEERLQGWTQAPEYLAKKRAISIFVGLMVGLVVATLGDLGMLHMLGMPAPRMLDVIVTGLVIGAGPGPMHSIIGALQGAKDTLAKLGDMAEGKAVRDAVAAVRNELKPQ